jgi:S-(hydroxymethyl)mycothiol dehydrogenase
VDFVLDVVGLGATARQGIAMLASGGTYVLVGLSPSGESVEIDLPRLFQKRTTILVSHGGDHLPQEDFPRLAQWALDGTLDLASMVTHVDTLDGWSAAFDRMREGDVIRTVLTP